MKWRHELKFMVDQATALDLIYTARAILPLDPHARPLTGARGGYRIRSLYFDDYIDAGVFDKLSGVDPRHKYRLRVYDTDDKIRLEKKIKKGAMTRKESCLVSRPVAQGLVDGDVTRLRQYWQEDPARRRLLGQFYADWQTLVLRPKLLVEYNRIPFIYNAGNVRLTVDQFISSGYFRRDLWDQHAGLKAVLEADRSIIEVKYDAFLPDFIADIVRRPGLAQIAVSKYILCSLPNDEASWACD